jgi:outer membrane lipoprotein-sorting protein
MLFGGATFAQDGAEEGTREREKPAEEGASKLDAAAVIAKVVKKMAEVKDMSCDSAMTVPLGPMVQKVSGKLTYKAKGLFRMEQTAQNPMTGEGQTTIIVNTGEKVVMFMEAMNSYQELPKDTPAASVMVQLAMDAKAFFDSVEITSAENVEAGGKSYERLTCEVPATGSTLKLDFGKEDGLLYRETNITPIDKHPMLKRMAPMLKAQGINELRSNGVYSNIKVNVGLEDSAFAFVPPEGAQKMDPGQMPGMGGMGGRRNAPKRPAAPKPAPPKPEEDDEDF